jgi:hypothetical protein
MPLFLLPEVVEISSGTACTIFNLNAIARSAREGGLGSFLKMMVAVVVSCIPQINLRFDKQLD